MKTVEELTAELGSIDSRIKELNNRAWFIRGELWEARRNKTIGDFAAVCEKITWAPSEQADTQDNIELVAQVDTYEDNQAIQTVRAMFKLEHDGRVSLPDAQATLLWQGGLLKLRFHYPSQIPGFLKRYPLKVRDADGYLGKLTERIDALEQLRRLITTIVEPEG